MGKGFGLFLLLLGIIILVLPFLSISFIEPIISNLNGGGTYGGGWWMTGILILFVGAMIIKFSRPKYPR